ncbi:metal ABC transporter substrate-binding protein [Natronomonas aquatica]|uniref:metal ABC transporter substrate-binding protein n=1 Tax=Natronomonas aquatica TaxID=2841590 RepID=UPI00210C92BA
MKPESTIRNEPGRLPRRAFLGLSAGALATGTAGCIGSASDDNDGDEYVAVASFFTFYDFARQIAQETSMTVENLIPAGLHGHGWDPDPSITRDIVDADAFVNVGPEFQPWADRALETVRDDGAGTRSINVREGIELIDLDETVDEEEAIQGGKDPHFWLDPELAKGAVDNIVEGLSAVAPEHEGTFGDNAADIKQRLDDLDADWEGIFERAARDNVFLAAHNAFGYVADRYDVNIQPLITNLAAADDVRTSDMQFAQDMIAEHDIRYIGAAIFEPNGWARQLVDETDAEAYYPVTPYAGVTEKWSREEWSYFDIARSINMPTFEIVLGSTAPEETTLEEEWRNFE